MVSGSLAAVAQLGPSGEGAVGNLFHLVGLPSKSLQLNDGKKVLMFSVSRNLSHQKTATKRILGKAVRKATLAANEYDRQNQKRPWRHCCCAAFFFSDHCSLGTFHFFLPPFSPASGPATGSFNGLHRESNFLAIMK
jgi:hypothetical protein